MHFLVSVISSDLPSGAASKRARHGGTSKAVLLAAQSWTIIFIVLHIVRGSAPAEKQKPLKEFHFLRESRAVGQRIFRLCLGEQQFVHGVRSNKDRLLAQEAFEIS